MKLYVLLVCYVLSFLATTNTASAETDSLSVNKLSVNITPSAWLDPWDGSMTRMAVEYRIAKDRSISLDGGIYFHDQPWWDLKQETSGFEIKPMFKQYGRVEQRYRKKPRKAYQDGYKAAYLGLELLFKHQVFNFEDSFHVANGPRFEKWYTINRFVAGASLVYGEEIAFKKLIIGYYVGAGIRYKHSTNNLTRLEKDSILTGEGHGDLTGAAVRSTGDRIAPGITLGFKIGLRIIR